MKKGYVYILECKDGSYYTGATTDLERRIQQHKIGKGAKYTRTKGALRLLYFESYPNLKQAYQREKEIQKLNRTQKEDLLVSKKIDLSLS